MNSSDLEIWITEQFEYFKENPVTTRIDRDENGIYYTISFNLPDGAVKILKGETKEGWKYDVIKELIKTFNEI